MMLVVNEMGRYEMENTMKEKEACDILSNAGFTAAEIARFQQLRRDYAKNKYGQGSNVLTITIEDAMNEMENAMEEKEACDILSNAGFTAAEIARFQQLQREYVEDTFSHLSATNRRHKFGSWLEAMIFGRTYPEWTRYE